ncbi:invasion associated locus B family protein [Bartonella sp. B30(2025)]
MKKLLSLIVISTLMSISSAAFAVNSKTAATKPAASTLPNGASSLTETYGLWSVNCGMQDDRKVCFIHRQEVNDQNRVVVAMTIVTDTNNNVSGSLTVPFGMLVSKPVRLQVDEGKNAMEAAIRTCLPSGCAVPVTFDKNFVTALRAGKKLKLAMTIAAPNEPAFNDLFIQLNGFSNALNRLIALQK